MKAYTIKIEALVISDSSIESSTPEQVLDLIIDHTNTMVATVVPMVLGDAKPIEAKEAQAVMDGPVASLEPASSERKGAHYILEEGKKLISTNRSWARPLVCGAMEFFDASTGETFQTSKRWRFRQESGCPEFLYSSHDYVGYCVRRPMGTYSSSIHGSHVYLTRTEAAAARNQIYAGRSERKQSKGGE